VERYVNELKALREVLVAAQAEQEALQKRAAEVRLQPCCALCPGGQSS
jgi:hypothetical protein